MIEKVLNKDRVSELWEKVKEETADTVTVPGGGSVELGPELGPGPYSFELTPEEEPAISAAQVSYDGTQSGIQAETVQEAVDALGDGLGRVSGRNLLTNWYFADPINQKGQTVYQSTGQWRVTIDRWASSLTITLEDGWLKVQNESTDAMGYLMQRDDVNEYKNFVGSVINISALYRCTGPGCYMNNGGFVDGTDVYIQLANARLVSDGEVHLASAASSPARDAVLKEFQRLALGVAPGATVWLKAAKLELGPNQTLAHQDEDGNWVLNDPPPDKALELAKCQRHMLVLDSFGDGYAGIGQGSSYSATNLTLNIPTPVSMRAKPALSMSGRLMIRGGGRYVAVDPLKQTYGVGSYSENVVTIDIGSFSNLPVNQMFELFFYGDKSARIILDANL